jgi:hypothetical protein
MGNSLDANQLHDELSSLAKQVACLVPCHRDPEAFHAAKSDIVHRLRCLASQQGHTPSKDGTGQSHGPVWKTNVQLVERGSRKWA